MEIKINIIDGAPLHEQSAIFQAWFNEEIMPRIDFAESCTSRDEFSRPKTWLFDKVRVSAEYLTDNENYNFKWFVIYGTL